MRSIKLIIIIMFCGFISVFSQDNARSREVNTSKKKRDGRFFIRAGIGAQGFVSFFYPDDINNFTKDFYNNLSYQFKQMGFYSSSGNDIPKFYAGYGYSYKAGLRVLNIFELEPYWDNFYAFPLNMKMDFTYGNSYYNTYDSYTANYQFQPIYDERGISLLFVPGSKRKHSFFTIGVGVGNLLGKFIIKTTGSQNIDGNFTDFSNSVSYTGNTTVYHGIIGITSVPWKFLELEFWFNGRYARIPSIKNNQGDELTNINRSDQKVALDFTGIDFRFGLTFIFP